MLLLLYFCCKKQKKRVKITKVKLCVNVNIKEMDKNQAREETRESVIINYVKAKRKNSIHPSIHGVTTRALKLTINGTAHQPRHMHLGGGSMMVWGCLCSLELMWRLMELNKEQFWKKRFETGPSNSPGLIDTDLEQNVEMIIQRYFPSSPTDLELFYNEE